VDISLEIELSDASIFKFFFFVKLFFIYILFMNIIYILVILY
jgi:hypothetical protein